MRKGGGAENSFDARSFAASTIDGAEGDAVAVTSMTTGSGLAGEVLEASTTSLSRLVFARVSRQFSAQHGIDECIAAILLPGFPTQHAAAVGSAVTKSTMATAMAVPNLFVKVEPGFTVYRTRKGVSVFHRP